MSAQEKPVSNIVSISGAPSYVLTARQLQAAKMTAAQQNTDEICKVVGLSLRTLYKWKKLSAFIAEVAKQNKSLVAQATKDIQNQNDRLGPLSIAVLMTALEAGDKKIALEIAKAKGLLKPKTEDENEVIDVVFKSLSFEEFNKGREG